MAVFLLESREDEERQAVFCRNEASSLVLKTRGGFTNADILMDI